MVCRSVAFGVNLRISIDYLRLKYEMLSLANLTESIKSNSLGTLHAEIGLYVQSPPCLPAFGLKITGKLSGEALDPLLGALQPRAAQSDQTYAALKQDQALLERELPVLQPADNLLQILQRFL